MDLGESCTDAARTIPERIFCQLSKAIVEGEIPTGSKISEADLASTYGVSRGPLREAISRLAAVGLVERQPNIGARVVELSSTHLLDIYHIREALEGIAARQAALNMSTEEMQRLSQTLGQHDEEMRKAGGPFYFQQSGDQDFHFQIVQGSHNQTLIKLLCHDLYYQFRLYRYQFGMHSNRGPAALAEHHHLQEAIVRRDAEMAELLMRSHIRASRENVKKMLQDGAERTMNNNNSSM